MTSTNDGWHDESEKRFQQMEIFDYFDLIKSIDLPNNATVDLAIDLFSIYKHCTTNGLHFDPNDFLDNLIGEFGENGNILIRAFNWDWCHGSAFDIRKTISQAGALGTIALKRDDFIRTMHPIYSWMVYGRDAEMLSQKNYKEAFCQKSIFAWEEANDNAFQVNIGDLQSNGITLFHYMEKKMEVSYRYTKDFTGEYIGYDGECNLKTYSMYVRNLDYDIKTDDNVYNKELINSGILQKKEYQGINISVYKIKELCSFYEKDFLNNITPSAVTISPI